MYTEFGKYKHWEVPVSFQKQQALVQNYLYILNTYKLNEPWTKSANVKHFCSKFSLSIEM